MARNIAPGAHQPWVLLPPAPGCGTLATSLRLSELQFPHLKDGVTTIRLLGRFSKQMLECLRGASHSLGVHLGSVTSGPCQ